MKSYMEFITEAEGHGQGWWHNTKTGKTHAIESEDLGPNGDHDGWIGIHKHAQELGVHAPHARAFTHAQYGAMVSDLPKEHHAEAMKIAQKFGEGPENHYVDFPFNRDDHAHEELFHRVHGMESHEALNFPHEEASHLLRVRKWPDGNFSVQSHSPQFGSHHIRHVQKVMDRVNPGGRDAEIHIDAPFSKHGGFNTTHHFLMAAKKPEDLY